MKTAQMFTVPHGGTEGFVWKWRCDEDKKESSQSFVRYHDCMTDAQAQGYTVELTFAKGNRAPGGAPQQLK
jgi:hypothetical protein